MAKKKKKIEQKDLSGLSTQDKMQHLDALLRNNFGKDSVLTPEQMMAKRDGMLSTGSIKVDLMLCQPLPIGIHEFQGKMGTGKSTMCAHIVQNAHKKGWPVYYLDMEYGLNRRFVVRFKGMDNSKWRILQPKTGEECCDMACQIFQTVDNAVVFLDSISSTKATEEVVAKTMKDSTMAPVAKLMSTFLAKVNPLIFASNGRLILINQNREGLSQYAPSPTLGGNAVEQFSYQRLKFSGGTKSTVITEDGQSVGKTVRIEVSKNRAAQPFLVSEVPLNFSKGFWNDMEILQSAKEMGLLHTKGSYWYDGEVLLGQGIGNACEYIEKNPDKKNEIIKKLFDIVSPEVKVDLKELYGI